MLVYQRVSHYVLITSEESTWNANAFLSYGLKGSKKKATGLQKYRPGDICNRSYSRHFQTPVTETYLSQHSWYTFQSTSQKQPWDWHMVSTIHIHIQSHIYIYILYIYNHIYIYTHVCILTQSTPSFPITWTSQRRAVVKNSWQWVPSLPGGSMVTTSTMIFVRFIIVLYLMMYLPNVPWSDIYIYTRMHIHIYIYIYTYNIFLHRHIHAHTHTYTYMYMCMYVYVYIYIYIWTWWKYLSYLA